MSVGDQHEREVRAARNQAMFRRVNEKLQQLNQAFEAVRDSHLIACECADPSCIETLEIGREEYEAVRKEPKRFAVLPGHVYPEVERVVRESDGYVVVEKLAAAAEVAESLDPRDS
jgi:hypothetical protein